MVISGGSLNIFLATGKSDSEFHYGSSIHGGVITPDNSAIRHYFSVIGPRNIYVEVRSRSGPKYAFFQGRNYDNVSHRLKKEIKFRPELSKIKKKRITDRFASTFGPFIIFFICF